MTDTFYDRIYRLVCKVPAGYVTTYGMLAMAAGSPRGARVVGGAMSRCGRNDVPCHRVVLKDGSLPASFGLAGSDYQRFLLKEEGVSFLADGRVDMSKHLYIFE